MTTTKRFPCRPESVQAARHYMRDALRGQGNQLVAAAELMTSELATNCVLHANTEFELAVTIGETIRVEVRDQGGGRPTPRSPGPRERTGRGLRIVEAMSAEWGIAPSPGGKTVWFALEASAARERDQRPVAASEGARAASRRARRAGARAARTRGCPGTDGELRGFRTGPDLRAEL